MGTRRPDREAIRRPTTVGCRLDHYQALTRWRERFGMNMSDIISTLVNFALHNEEQLPSIVAKYKINARSYIRRRKWTVK